MKNNLFFKMLAILVLLVPSVYYSQAPNLGSSKDFVLFTTVGAVTNTGTTILTGNVGTNSGSSTGFGNVNGIMSDGGPLSSQAAADLLIAYDEINSAIPTFFPAPLLGNGQTLNEGVYLVSSPGTLNLGLNLDAQGDPNAVFIIHINGSFSANANSSINLLNGALACNVFWKIEGLVSLSSNTDMKGTIIANNSAINMSVNTKLEGRALAINGAISVNGITGKTPIGCGSPILDGPIAPNLNSTACFALFSSNGENTNAGITNVVGHVGTNVGLTTGFNALLVDGNIHPIPNVATANCASDLTTVYTYLHTLTDDITLLYPAQFGNNLELTAHTYMLNAATALTDTVILNANGNADAVFVIKINGALSTSTFSYVKLINGTQAKNVFWKVEGAVDISDFSTFNGTIICNNGALNLSTGVILNGRAFTTTGAVTTFGVTIELPACCPPEIVIQPTDVLNLCDLYNTTFTVDANFATTYLWEESTDNGASWNPATGGIYSGETTATLILTGATAIHNNNKYRCIVIGDCLPDATSNEALLTVSLAGIVPTSLSTTNVTRFQATLNWGNVAGMSDFRIALKKVGTSLWHYQNAPYSDSYVFNSAGGLTTDATYEWRVKVKNTTTGCWSDWSSLQNFVVCIYPVAVTSLTETNIYSNKVTLNWVSSTTVEEIRIALRKVGTTTWNYKNAPYTANSYEWVANFTKNVNYEWMIKMRCGDTWGPWSSTGTFTSGNVAGMITLEDNNSFESNNPFELTDVNIEVYPNPSDGNFTISSTVEGTFQVVNELGQKIRTVEITKEMNYQTKIENVESGIYFVTGIMDGMVVTQKIVVN